MSSTASEEARTLGNTFYKAGKLSEAEKAYEKAASLAPCDLSPISNLSAVRYEMGDYQGAIAYIREALSLNTGATDASVKTDKLYGRLVKCFMHLLEFGSAKDAISCMTNSHLRAELCESVESMMALWAEVPDESVLRRQVLEEIGQYKPRLQDIPEYYCVGHDQVAPLTEPLGMLGTAKQDISLFFAGSGDGRNVFSAIASMALRDSASHGSTFGKLHSTVLDLKPAALARVLIFFNMMARADFEVSSGVPNATDYFLAMAYIFSCQIIPPQAETILQSNIDELIKRLEGKSDAFQFIHVREQDRKPLIRVLRQWQKPWDGMSKVADVRKFIEQERALDNVHKTSPFGQGSAVGTGSERIDFENFTTLLLPTAVAKRWEPKLTDALSEYRSTEVASKVMIGLTLSYVEIIVGEVADIMERMRYHILDHRLSGPTDSQALDPSSFPWTFDYMHMSNIPDYIGGHLTTFLVCRPLLKEDRPSSLRLTNLLNPPEFEDHKAFQSEYLLMYDMERIRQHFSLARRPGEIAKEDLPPTFDGLMNPFAFEGYMVWDRVSNSKMSFNQLLPKAELEKWMYGHFLKICLPFPRPIFSGAPVYAPLTLSTLIRLMIRLWEVGYPAHWLLGIFACICTGAITTSARPPTSRVCTPTDVDTKRQVKDISVQPWVAEFTTLLSIWRRLLPFGIGSLNGAVVPLKNIYQYSITFPPFRNEHELSPHFILLFWNVEVGYTLKPPSSLYGILASNEGREPASRDIRDKGIACVSAFRYTTSSRTAVFWMRADKMEEMMSGKWRAFIWRTDAWKAVTDGVDVSTGTATGKNWTTSLGKPCSVRV